MAKAKAQESEVVDESTDFEDEFDKIADAKLQTEEPDLDAAAAEDATDGSSDAIKAKDMDPDPEPDPVEPIDADPDPDPYEGMSEAAKAKFIEIEESNTKLNHRLNSDNGRVAAFQRQVKTLKQENSNLRAGPAPAKPTPNQIANAMKGSNESWDQFKEDYPEVAKAIDGRLEMAGKGIQNSLDQTLAPVVTKQAQIDNDTAANVTQGKVAEVAKTYPEWSAAVQTQEFVDWLVQQPPGIAALSESDDTKDASALISMYDEHLVANGKPTLKATPEPASKLEENPDGSEATNLAKKRAQQLADGTTVESRNAKIDAGAEPKGDFEAAFDSFAKRKDAQRATA